MAQIIQLAERIDSESEPKTEVHQNNTEQPQTQHPDQSDVELTKKLIQNKYPNKILFTIKEVAQELNLSYEAVRLFVINDQIPSIAFGRRRMIHLNQLIRILTEGVISCQ